MAKKRVARFYIFCNRMDTPIVIRTRIFKVIEATKNTFRVDILKRKIEVIFEGTKVQVGEFWDEGEARTHLFIRNGYKGRAHFLIHQRKIKINKL